MNLSKSILDIILNEVIADEMVEEETKETIKNVFNSNNAQEIDSLILRNLIFFAKYPIIKEISTNPIFIDECLSFMKTSNFIEIDQLLSRLSDNINLHDFLNQEKLVNSFLEDANLLSILGRINGFFNYFNDPIRSNIIKTFLSKGKIDIITLQRLPNDVVDKLLNNDLYKESIYQDVLARILDGILLINSLYVEAKIWETYHERITLLSLKNKIDYFNYINDKSLKMKVLEELKLTEEISNISAFDLKKMAPYLDQELLFNNCLSKDINVISKFMPFLDTEHQIRAINELDKLGVRIFQFYYELNSDTKSYLFKHYPQILNNYEIYQLYKEAENINCLIELKSRFMKYNDIITNVLYEDDFVKLLTDEEKQILASKIPEEGMVNLPYDVLKLNSYFFNIVKTKNINYLRQNPDVSLFYDISSLIKYFTISEQLEIIKHMNLHWLTNIFEDETSFNFALNIFRNVPDFLQDKDLSKLKIGYVDNALLDRIDEILPYFKENQLCFFFNNQIINSHPKILKLFKAAIHHNPNLFPSLELLNLFTKEEQNELFRKMSIEHFNDVMNIDY